MTKGYFKSFYSEMEELHKAVKPFRTTYYLNRMSDAWKRYGEAVARFAVVAIRAKATTNKMNNIIDAVNKGFTK